MLPRIFSALPPDTLGGHRSRFYDQYKALTEFYHQSANLQFFKNLIKVPHLPKVSCSLWQNIESWACLVNSLLSFTGAAQFSECFESSRSRQTCGDRSWLGTGTRTSGSRHWPPHRHFFHSKQRRHRSDVTQSKSKSKWPTEKSSRPWWKVNTQSYNFIQ